VRWLIDLNLTLQLSWFIVLATLFPLLVGLWLDRHLHTTPVFVLFGLAAGIYASIQGVRRRLRVLETHEVYQESTDTLRTDKKEERPCGES